MREPVQRRHRLPLRRVLVACRRAAPRRSRAPPPTRPRTPAPSPRTSPHRSPATARGAPDPSARAPPAAPRSLSPPTCRRTAMCRGGHRGLARLLHGQPSRGVRAARSVRAGVWGRSPHGRTGGRVGQPRRRRLLSSGSAHGLVRAVARGAPAQHHARLTGVWGRSPTEERVDGWDSRAAGASSALGPRTASSAPSPVVPRRSTMPVSRGRGGGAPTEERWAGGTAAPQARPQLRVRSHRGRLWIRALSSHRASELEWRPAACRSPRLRQMRLDRALREAGQRDRQRVRRVQRLRQLRQPELQRDHRPALAPSSPRRAPPPKPSRCSPGTRRPRSRAPPPRSSPPRAPPQSRTPSARSPPRRAARWRARPARAPRSAPTAARGWRAGVRRARARCASGSPRSASPRRSAHRQRRCRSPWPPGPGRPRSRSAVRLGAVRRDAARPGALRRGARAQAAKRSRSLVSSRGPRPPARRR